MNFEFHNEKLCIEIQFISELKSFDRFDAIRLRSDKYISDTSLTSTYISTRCICISVQHTTYALDVSVSLFNIPHLHSMYLYLCSTYHICTRCICISVQHITSSLDVSVSLFNIPHLHSMYLYLCSTYHIFTRCICIFVQHTCICTQCMYLTDPITRMYPC